MTIAPGTVRKTPARSSKRRRPPPSTAPSRSRVVPRGRSSGAACKRDKVTMVALVASSLLLLLGIVSPLLSHLGVIDPDAQPPRPRDRPRVAARGLRRRDELGALAGRRAGHRPRHVLPHPHRADDLAHRGHPRDDHLAVVIGVILGIIAGFAGGRIDWCISRFMDLVLSFPSTLMLLSLQADPRPADRRRHGPVGQRGATQDRLHGRRARLLRLPVLRPHHPRSGAVPARARVHRGGPVPGVPSARGSTSRSCSPISGRRSSSTRR